MLKTKLAKRVLSAMDQSHLNDINVHSMAAFKRTRKAQLELLESHPDGSEPCWECKQIAKKLGME